MKKEISVLIPTRGRAGKLPDLIDNIFTSSRKSERVEICFYIDEDDTASFNVLSNISLTKENVLFKKGPRVIFSDMWNQLLDIATADIYMVCGDDVHFKTVDWDQKIIDQFEQLPKDKIGYICVNDEIHRDVMGVHGFLHKNWVNVLGYITPNMFVYNWADVWIDEISRIIDRRFYRNDIIVSHCHWCNQKAQFDTTYQENDEKYAKVKSDVEKLFTETRCVREEEARKLQKFIEEYK